MSKAIFTAQEFVNRLKEIESNYHTVYCWGSFGFPVTSYNITRLARQYPAIYTSNEQAKLTRLIGQPNKIWFAFDCVGLIKGALWNWKANPNSSNGGAQYCSNGVGDIDCNGMFDKCSGKTTDFSNIEVGEFLWRDGHIGVYIGDELGIECTPIWKNGVQITAVENIGPKKGYETRRWTKHGKSPYLDYGNSEKGQNSGKNSPIGVRECGCIYLSAGAAAKRMEPSVNSTLKGRCEKGKYYVSSGISKDENGHEWFKHADCGLYSSINDISTGAGLFKLTGTYTAVKTNSNCRVRAGAGLSYAIITTLTPGKTVYWTGETKSANGYAWAKIIYDGQLRYCDEQWLDV